MTDSRHSTPERGNKSVLCPVFETAVTLSSAGCHTLCASSRGPRSPCEIKQKLVIAFPFQTDRRAVEVCCVQCPVFVQLCPSHQLGDSYCVHAAGRAACEINYKFGHYFSSTQFGSPTAQRSLLNLAVQQTKGLGMT